MASLPPCPPILKAVQPYLKIALEHDKRDPVVSYWCRMYALQTGLKIDKTKPESLKLLTSLMDWLETTKRNNADSDAFSNEIVAQAHIENYTLKLFVWADTEDRGERWNKNVVKAFYTSYTLFGLLSLFGELTEENSKHEKYAKWKAAYIHNCLRTGETPIAGPLPNEEEETFSVEDNAAGSGSADFPASGGLIPGHFDPSQLPNIPTDFSEPPDPKNVGWPSPNIPSYPPAGDIPTPFLPPSQPAPNLPPAQPTPTMPSTQPTPVMPSTQPYRLPESNVPLTAVHLTPDQTTKAQKYCKFASSALNYDDNNTAVMYLSKALRLLTTGKDE